MKNKILLILLFSFSLSLSATSTPLFTKTEFSVRNGLPSSDITAIIQNRDGKMWIGTADGLATFNGSQFQVFDRSNSALPSNHITALYVASDHSLWIGTEKGIVKAKGGDFTTFPSMKHSVISITSDNKGVISVSSVAGAFILSGVSFHPTKTKIESLKTRWDKEKKQFHLPHISALFVDRESNKWVGTRSGLFLFIFGPFSLMNSKTTTSLDRKKNTLFRDSHNALWKTEKEKLILLSPQSKRVFVLGQQSNRINSLLEDSQGRLWVGTNNGLYLKMRDTFIRYKTGKATISTSVQALYEDDNKRLWILSKESGITLLYKGISYTLNSLNGLPADTISAMVESNDNTFWFCSMRGVFSISAKALNSFLDKSSDKIIVRKYGVGDGLPYMKCLSSGKNIPPHPNNRPFFETERGTLLINSTEINVPTPPDSTIDAISSDGIPLPLLSKDITIFAGSSLSISLSATSIRYPDQIRFEWKLNSEGSTWNKMESRKTLSLETLDPGEYTLRFRAFFHAIPATKPGKDIAITFLVKPQKSLVGYLLFGAALTLFIISIFLWIRYRKSTHTPALENNTFHTENYPPHLAVTLQKVLGEERLYRDPDLTLSHLSKKCGTNTATLSRFINRELSSTFYNLINGYRLEEIKQLLVDSELQHRSILSLAYRAGFKSKTTFNTMFKRETTLTPTEWRKQKTE